MVDLNAVFGDRCMVHGTTMVLTRSVDAEGRPAREFLSCPECNAAAIDRMNARPGTITINVGTTRR